MSGGQPVSGPARPLGGRSGGLFLKVDPSPPCTVPSTHRPRAWNILPVQAQNLRSQSEWANADVPQWAWAGRSWTGVFFPTLSPSHHLRTDWHLEVPAVLLYWVKPQWGPWGCGKRMSPPSPDPGPPEPGCSQRCCRTSSTGLLLSNLGTCPLPLWSPLLLPLTASPRDTQNAEPAAPG